MNFPKPSQYPKQIRFGEELYTIRFVRFKGDTLGECDPEKLEIRLKKGMSNQETLKTFIHEILHVLEFEHPLNLAHSKVYKLEAAIYQLLIDNLFLG